MKDNRPYLQITVDHFDYGSHSHGVYITTPNKTSVRYHIRRESVVKQAIEFLEAASRLLGNKELRSTNESLKHIVEHLINVDKKEP